MADLSHATRISAANSDTDVLIIPTDEEAVIARSTQVLVWTIAPTGISQA